MKKNAEYWLRRYRAHFYYDHWAPMTPTDSIGTRSRTSGINCFIRNDSAPRSLNSEHELMWAAENIKSLGFKLVIRNASKPKISIIQRKRTP